MIKDGTSGKNLMTSSFSLLKMKQKTLLIGRFLEIQITQIIRFANIKFQNDKTSNPNNER